MSRHSLALALTFLALLMPRAALAQRQRTIAVVPVTTAADTGPPERAEQVAQSLRNALRSHGASILSAEEMKDRFERRHSTEPTATETGVYEELSACAHDLLIAVSDARYRQAQEAGVRCRELAEASLESLNRRVQSAREVLDACLYVVRATVDADSRQDPSDAALARARAEMLRCRAMVPDLPPTERRHTDLIRDLLREVDADLAQLDNSLEVDSTQQGCRVYVNGRRLGSTPLHRTGLPQGSYRVQVECGDAPGRVHVVNMGDGPLRLLIDERFDAAVSTRRGLSLRYPSTDALERHRGADALTIAETVGASQVWLVSPGPRQTWRIDRLGRDECSADASALVSLDEAGSDLRFQAAGVAVERLLAERSADLSAPREASMEPWASAHCAAAANAEPPTPSPTIPASDAEALRVVGWTGLGVGIAAIAGGWGAWVAWAYDNDGVPLYPSASWTDGERRAWEDRRSGLEQLQIAAVVTSASGALILGATLPLWLPDEEEFPWWSALPAAAGVGLAVWGAYLVAIDGQCSREHQSMIAGAPGCETFYTTASQGVLALLSAAPLLEVPLVYLFREVSGGGPDSNSASLRVLPTSAGVSLALEGAW